MRYGNCTTLLVPHSFKRMTKATYSDKALVVDILAKSFADNSSVNYIIKQDRKKILRLKRLMEYSFDTCFAYGEILLSGDRKGCALIIFPEKKRITLKSILSDVKLIISCIGIRNAIKAMKRESAIKKVQPKELIYYLWFIGVETTAQNKGIGTRLIQEIINHSAAMERTICLETSTIKNIPWYQQFGFTIYNELDFGYRLYCLKKELLK
jgi:ribosomal protein S18 acetylase RimI-like enzyme